LPTVKIPKRTWFYDCWKENYSKEYAFSILKVDVCNLCSFLGVKIKSATGQEKAQLIERLQHHKNDAKREYVFEIGKLFLNYHLML